MKKKFGVFFLLALAACSAGAPKGEKLAQVEGRSHTVVLTGALQNELPGDRFFVMPAEGKDGWSLKERDCALALIRALELSGLQEVHEIRKAQLLVSVQFPKTAKAADLTLTALLGGYRHSVSLEARNQKRKLVWTLEGYIEDESDDIATVFPFLAAAMVGRFGKDAAALRVSVGEFDPVVERVKAAGGPDPASRGASSGT